MADYACIVHADQAPIRKRAELDAGLREIARVTFGESAQDVAITWITVAPGFGFTAGTPSTSSLVVRSVPHGFPDDQRTRLMTRISDLWQDVTGCTADEIVVTALDGPLPL
jgi:hypothetical protein